MSATAVLLRVYVPSMAESVTYQRIRLNLWTPWPAAQGGQEEWSVKFSLSGGTNLLATEMEATALDLFDPLKQLCRTHTYLGGWRYYPIQGHTATGLQDYTPSQHPATGSAWNATTTPQQITVCALARCYVGKSATGKPVYLRKWIHDIISDGSGDLLGGFAAGVTQTTILAKWNTGSGPKLLVPVDPTGGTQGGPWTLDTNLRTHQLRRGPKRKAKTTTVYLPVPVP